MNKNRHSRLLTWNTRQAAAKIKNGFPFHPTDKFYTTQKMPIKENSFFFFRRSAHAQFNPLFQTDRKFPRHLFFLSLPVPQIPNNQHRNGNWWEILLKFSFFSCTSIYPNLGSTVFLHKFLRFMTLVSIPFLCIRQAVC